MKFIEFFFQLLSQYQELKYQMKCAFETHKMNCEIALFKVKNGSYGLKDITRLKNGVQVRTIERTEI